MSLRTIVVTLDGTSLNDDRCELARLLAEQHGAHLIGLANRVPVRLPLDVADVFNVGILDAYEAQRDEIVAGWVADFDAKTRDRGLRSYETRVSHLPAAEALLTQARYADLLVVSQPASPPLAGAEDETDLMRLVIEGGRPVLFVPFAGQHARPIERALIAWSATPESQRAVSDALPLLQRCQRVDVAVLNPHPGHDGHGEAPGADLSLYLARHGLNVHLHVFTTPLGVGEELLSRAADLRSDLLVMGCFGHSRLRERLVGGASLTMLRSMTLPVLFSH